MSRYLEDVIPLLKFQSSLSEYVRSRSDAVAPTFRDEYESLGLDDPSITALYEITRSNRIDYQVYFILFSFLSVILTYGT